VVVVVVLVRERDAWTPGVIIARRCGRNDVTFPSQPTSGLRRSETGLMGTGRFRSGLFSHDSHDSHLHVHVSKRNVHRCTCRSAFHRRCRLFRLPGSVNVASLETERLSLWLADAYVSWESFLPRVAFGTVNYCYVWTRISAVTCICSLCIFGSRGPNGTHAHCTGIVTLAPLSQSDVLTVTALFSQVPATLTSSSTQPKVILFSFRSVTHGGRGY
jgi:hypothetical protein